MKLVQFRQKHNDNKPIVIAADKVVSIYTLGEDTYISVAVPNSNGVPYSYIVAETLHEVVGKLA